MCSWLFRSVSINIPWRWGFLGIPLPAAGAWYQLGNSEDPLRHGGWCQVDTAKWIPPVSFNVPSSSCQLSSVLICESHLHLHIDSPITKLSFASLVLSFAGGRSCILHRTGRRKRAVFICSLLRKAVDMSVILCTGTRRASTFVFFPSFVFFCLVARLRPSSADASSMFQSRPTDFKHLQRDMTTPSDSGKLCRAFARARSNIPIPK